MTDETLAAELARHSAGDRLETGQLAAKDLASAQVIDRCLVDLRILEKQYAGGIGTMVVRLVECRKALEAEYAAIMRRWS